MSRHEIFNPPGLAPPLGFSHAVKAAPGRLVTLGGQTSHGPDGVSRGEGIVEQFDFAAANVVGALAAAGGRPEDIVTLQIFVVDIPGYRAELPALGEVWRRNFGRHYPACGLFGVTGLFDDASLVELMAVAVVPER